MGPVGLAADDVGWWALFVARLKPQFGPDLNYRARGAQAGENDAFAVFYEGARPAATPAPAVCAVATPQSRSVSINALRRS